MAKTINSSQQMTDGQIENIVGKLRDALCRHRAGISTDVAQQVLGERNLGMMMFAPFLDLVKRKRSYTTPPKAFFKTREGLFVSEDFRKLVLAQASPSADGCFVAMKSRVLERDMSNTEIEELLGAGHLFAEGNLCDTIAEMIQKQWGGKKGTLLNDGRTNLFYTSSGVVHVRWSADDRGWGVSTWRRDGHGWYAGDQAFSPATGA